jgi:hypothetical protein
LTTFLFGTKGAKRKVIGQKHSRLERERVARAQYSLFFPIFKSASSSAGRADLKIKRETPNKEISLVATSDQGSAHVTASLCKGLSETSLRRYQ